MVKLDMTEMSHSLNDTEKIAKKFLENLVPQSHGATIVGLFGDLGAGKTTFSQAIAKILGIHETVTSPTFIIEKIYKIEADFKFKTFIHIDAYRLESGKELEHLGWKEITEDKNNLIFLEWPEKVSKILPADIKRISFTFIDESTRKIEF